MDVDFKIVKMDTKTGIATVRYFLVDNPAILLEYQYEVPVYDGVLATPEQFLAILALRKPFDSLKRMAGLLDDDYSSFKVIEQPDPEPEPEVIPEVTFGELKAEMLSSIDATARNIRNSIMSSYSAFEAVSWPIKLEEARAVSQLYVAGTPEASVIETTAPLLTAEALYRGCSVYDLHLKVLNKSTQFSQIEALISGYCGNLIDRVRSVPEGDIEALRSIDIVSEWPVL